MAEDKKSDSDNKTLQEERLRRERTNDYAEHVRKQDVTNTRPAPPNPNRDQGGSNKDD